jgi:uncharacterized protein (TIGR02466 family)
MLGGATENGILLAWPTPVLRRVMPDSDEVNTALLARVQRERGQAEGVRRSNQGSWHSDEVALTWQPEMAQVARWVEEGVLELTALTSSDAFEPDSAAVRMTAWANVSTEGDYHRLHRHPGSHWSAVYYVQGPAGARRHDLSGCIELVDPRSGSEMVPMLGAPFGRSLTVRPSAGLLLVFPAWLAHCVHPVMGEGERVSIAFNCTVELETRRVND